MDAMNLDQHMNDAQERGVQYKQHQPNWHIDNIIIINNNNNNNNK